MLGSLLQEEESDFRFYGLPIEHTLGALGLHLFHFRHPTLKIPTPILVNTTQM